MDQFQPNLPAAVEIDEMRAPLARRVVRVDYGTGGPALDDVGETIAVKVEDRRCEGVRQRLVVVLRTGWGPNEVGSPRHASEIALRVFKGHRRQGWAVRGFGHLAVHLDYACAASALHLDSVQKRVSP